MDSVDMFPKRRKIATEDGETSSAISKKDYEVFLSFRGPDTRQGFTDCLYHAMIDLGIVVFMDDDELAPGDRIDDILIALNNSKICMVVLSPIFAESAWCLREVERMVDMKKDIVPIFYHVTPDDVKLKTELYASALTIHETKHGKEKVQKWRNALKEIPTIKGWELKNTGFIEFTRQIAKDILTKLKVKNKYEIENFVEVSDEVESALKLLDIGSDSCRYLGIYGMGGIGKTTLAKVIFNQISDKFDYSCFLENIRGNISQSHGGLHKLQEELLRSLDPSLRHDTYIAYRMEKLKKNFTGKKVIVVLDDIDDKNHFLSLVGMFGIGSRIIFTTRNAELHKETNLPNADFCDGMGKKEMDSKQALKLFSRHAFGDNFPPKDFESLSMEAISTTGGLPLALELVGSRLHRRKTKVWRETINNLKEAPHQDVQRMLKLSYDDLDSQQQEIFLDIASFFIGVEKANAIYMWKASKFDANIGVQVLISMSLIKLNDKKCFWMHDQLRDFGRAIVKVNSTDTRAGSRLWMHKDGVELLKRSEGKEKVEGLHLDKLAIYLDRENFVGLEKLRFLQLTECANLCGNFDGLIPNLRWLSLLNASSFNITNLYLRELVVLELSWCRFDETWPGWDQILISQHLKVLTLSNCNELISTPDLSKVVNLERLSLSRCHKLTSLHSSVENLQCLRRLSILKWISTKHTSLNLLESIGCLVSLTRLDLRGIVHLPNSLGELVKLKHLSLMFSPGLRVLPDSIGNLRSLISLNLLYTGITELATTIGGLAELKSLNLSECKGLKRLPDSIENLHSLIDLNLRGCFITELTDSVSRLERLERLDIGHSNGACWIREVSELPISLTYLNVRCVKKIQNLSKLINLSHLEIHNAEVHVNELVEFKGIEKLSKLIQLDIQDFNVQSFPMELTELHQLKSLNLCCPSMEFRECQLPWRLESVSLDIKKWGQLPSNLSSLKKLSELKLSNFVIEEADSIEAVESLEVLEMKSCILKFNNFPVLKRLRNLCLKSCRSHLSSSSIDDFTNQVPTIGLEFQVQLSNIKNLSELKLSCFWIPVDGFKVAGVEGFESLLCLDMKECILIEFTDNLSVLKSLTSLALYNCSFPTIASLDIPQLDHLDYLDIDSCDDIDEIQGLGKLKSLRKLNILICPLLQRIEGLVGLKGLKEVDIISCPQFEGIDGVDRLLSSGTLSRLEITNCKCKDVDYSSTFMFVYAKSVLFTSNGNTVSIRIGKGTWLQIRRYHHICKRYQTYQHWKNLRKQQDGGQSKVPFEELPKAVSTVHMVMQQTLAKNKDGSSSKSTARSPLHKVVSEELKILS